jgi:hypothetical protein
MWTIWFNVFWRYFIKYKYHSNYLQLYVIIGHGKRTMDTVKNSNLASTQELNDEELMNNDSTAYLLSLLKEKYRIE